MTGIDSAYEVPVNPEIIINTSTKTIDQCLLDILKVMKN
jgi:adenylylsulfate kinase-like enzyme